MKNELILIVMACGLMLTTAVVEGEHHEHAGEMTEESQESTDAVEVGNTICPISGGKVDHMGDPFKMEYNGKVYNLCCAMCKKDFLKDPEKYSKIAEDEAAQNESEDHDNENHDHNH